ncbi:MAG: TIGR04255 family protein, partial [Microcystis panniformis]
LTFPPILKISHQEPVEFQDEIRFQYPLFERTQPQIPPEIAKVVQQFNFPLSNNSAYIFKSEDQKWKLAVDKDLIALTTSAYERYEYFREKLEFAVTIFERIYKPSFYT